MTKKNPGQTVRSIVDAASELFVKKGYDKTSVQDIVDAVGMTKGAIFHHFRSKEDILGAVIDRRYEVIADKLNRLADGMTGVSAREKLVAIFDFLLLEGEEDPLDEELYKLTQSPHMVVRIMQDNVNRDALLFYELMEEGVADGSITTEFPQECMQVLILLASTWCDPGLFECDRVQLRQRIKFVQTMMRNMGADVISDEIVEKGAQFAE